jgi:type I restriction enzyme M protein
MLDSETKRRIDTARDILVGKVPDPKSQVEQITIALIYKFMDDMDAESEEMGGARTFFTGEFEKYGWAKLMSPAMGGHDVINLYSEAIQKMDTNPGIPQLLRDMFKNAYLPYRDPETLKSFLKIINDFEYDHSERLGDAFEYLLSVLGSQGEAGQFRTPRHIIDFMVEAVDPKKEDIIIDPACGTAGFLISSYKHIIRYNSSNFNPDEYKIEFGGTNGHFKGDKLKPDERKKLANNIRGYDISPDMVRLSLVNMYLHGFTDPHIYEYDTLTSEDRWNEYGDVIMANPPFMSPKGGIKPHKRFSIQANRSEVLFVDYIAEHLRPNGRAAVIVPEGIIFQSGTAYKALRKMLVGNYLYAVVSLPTGVFNPYSGVKTSILLMDKSIAKKTADILFVKIENDGFSLGAQRKPIEKSDLLEALSAIKAFKQNVLSSTGECNSLLASVVQKSEIAANDDYNLSAERYRKIDTRDNKWPMVELDKIFETIKNGCNVNQQDEKGKYRVTRIQTISTGVVNLQNTKWTNDEVNDDCFMRGGDILFSHINSFEHLAKSAIFKSDEKVVHGINLIRFRPKKNIILPEYAAYIFKSDIFIKKAKTFAQKAVNQASIKTSDLKTIQIPLPPLRVQQEIIAEIEDYQKIIDGARQVVDHYKPQIKINPEWPVKYIGEICTLTTGGTPNSSVKEYYEGGEIKWLVSGDIHKGEIYDCENHITEKGLENSNAKWLPVNSVLIALNGQGKTRGTVAVLRTKATCNQSIVSIYPNNKEYLIPEFLYYQLKARYQEIRNLTGDNQRSGLNIPIIRNISIAVPELIIQRNIVDRISTEVKLIEANEQIIQIYEQKIKDRIAEVWEAV